QAELEMAGEDQGERAQWSDQQWTAFWALNPNGNPSEREVTGSTLGAIQFKKLREKIQLDMQRRATRSTVTDRLKFFKLEERKQRRKQVRISQNFGIAKQLN